MFNMHRTSIFDRCQTDLMEELISKGYSISSNQRGSVGYFRQLLYLKIQQEKRPLGTVTLLINGKMKQVNGSSSEAEWNRSLTIRSDEETSFSKLIITDAQGVKKRQVSRESSSNNQVFRQ